MHKYYTYFFEIPSVDLRTTTVDALSLLAKNTAGLLTKVLEGEE